MIDLGETLKYLIQSIWLMMGEIGFFVFGHFVDLKEIFLGSTVLSVIIVSWIKMLED